MAQKTVNPHETGGSKMYLIPLFLLLFGVFFVVHAFFVCFLNTEIANQPPHTAALVLLVHVVKTSGWALLIFLLSHLFSFFWNYIGQRKYRETVLEHRVTQPFGRVVLPQILILFGAFAVVLLGGGLIPLLILIVTKTALDLGYHFYYQGPEEDESAPAGVRV